MSGFYGKFYQEKGLSFRDFIFRNSGKNKETFPAISDQEVFEATSAEDSGAIVLGNRWISLSSAEDGAANGLVLFHNSPGGSTTPYSTVSGVKTLTDEEVAALKTAGKQLHFGQGVVFENFTYDKAGHVVARQEDTWLMPSAPAVDFADQIQTSVEELQQIVGVGDNPDEATLVPRVEWLEKSTVTSDVVKELAESLDGNIANTEKLRTDLGYLGNMGIIENADVTLVDAIGSVYGLKSKWSQDSDTIIGCIGKLDDLTDQTNNSSLVAVINALAAEVEQLRTDLGVANIAIEALKDKIDMMETQSE